VLELGRRGNAAIKLSGPFRYSRQSWPYADCDPYVHALIDAFTLDHCVWGSDWPFVRLPNRYDYGPTRALLDRWLPDAADRRRVLWDNPRRWFGFAQS
jgi:predicted TIM-barrel fold metal-dependent hydrolase